MNDLRSSNMSLDSTKLMIVADVPLIIRMQRKFLFSLRKLMLEWDRSPVKLYLDNNDYSFPINDFKISYATANNQ